MIIKLRNVFTKKCSNQINYLFKLFFFIFLFSFKISNIYSTECKFQNKIKVGLIDNDYIDYSYYLYYFLGNFSLHNEIDFELQKVDSNIDEFDIIFGDYFDLKKLSKRKINIPDKLSKFYENNGIIISNNIFPLDLDSFVILSKGNKIQSNLESLANLYSPVRYTLGMTFLPKHQLINFVIYNLENEKIILNNTQAETYFNLLNKIYKNLNKNILFSNYNELYQSYENLENEYTLFTDGILLDKNTQYSSFQSFPKSKYKWNDEKGLFKINDEFKPISFYGFSAYLNNENQTSFLCYLITEENRLNTFKNFNIQISPFSINELKKIRNEIPKDYIEILEEKNKFIVDINYNDEIKKYKNIMLFFEKKNYHEGFLVKDYLN